MTETRDEKPYPDRSGAAGGGARLPSGNQSSGTTPPAALIFSALDDMRKVLSEVQRSLEQVDQIGRSVKEVEAASHRIEGAIVMSLRSELAKALEAHSSALRDETSHAARWPAFGLMILALANLGSLGYLVLRAVY